MNFGALAQLGERLICIQEVNGSIPLGSTNTQFASRIGVTMSDSDFALGQNARQRVARRTRKNTGS